MAHPEYLRGARIVDQCRRIVFQRDLLGPMDRTAGSRRLRHGRGRRRGLLVAPRNRAQEGFMSERSARRELALGLLLGGGAGLTAVALSAASGLRNVLAFTIAAVLVAAAWWMLN